VRTSGEAVSDKNLNQCCSIFLLKYLNDKDIVMNLPSSQHYLRLLAEATDAESTAGIRVK